MIDEILSSVFEYEFSLLCRMAEETKIKGGNLVIALSALREIAISVPPPPHPLFLVLIWGLLDPILQCVLSIFIFLYMVNASTMESI